MTIAVPAPTEVGLVLAGKSVKIALMSLPGRPGTSASASLSWDPSHSSRGQRDSVVPPLQCPVKEEEINAILSVEPTGVRKCPT